MLVYAAAAVLVNHTVFLINQINSLPKLKRHLILVVVDQVLKK